LHALPSTGPRSCAGKAITARNSRRHGLTLPVLDEPSLAREVVALARRIETSVTGQEANAADLAACRIAEAMIDLKRVRLAKLPLLAPAAARIAKTNPTEKCQRFQSSGFSHA
jgi:hypothetical protein